MCHCLAPSPHINPWAQGQPTGQLFHHLAWSHCTGLSCHPAQPHLPRGEQMCCCHMQIPIRHHFKLIFGLLWVTAPRLQTGHGEPRLRPGGGPCVPTEGAGLQP